MNQSMRANSKLDDSRCNDRDRSRIILDTSYIPHLDLEKCDQENVNLPSYVSIYAKEIFEYLQENNVVYFLNLMNLRLILAQIYLKRWLHVFCSK